MSDSCLYMLSFCTMFRRLDLPCCLGGGQRRHDGQIGERRETRNREEVVNNLTSYSPPRASYSLAICADSGTRKTSGKLARHSWKGPGESRTVCGPLARSAALILCFDLFLYLLSELRASAVNQPFLPNLRGELDVSAPFRAQKVENN